MSDYYEEAKERFSDSFDSDSDSDVCDVGNEEQLQVCSVQPQPRASDPPSDPRVRELAAEAGGPGGGSPVSRGGYLCVSDQEDPENRWAWVAELEKRGGYVSLGASTHAAVTCFCVQRLRWEHRRGCACRRRSSADV